MNISTHQHYATEWTAIESDSYDGAPDAGSAATIGHGNTEAAAIADLIEKFEDGKPWQQAAVKAYRAGLLTKANEIATRFGMQAREVPLGIFLAHVTQDRFGHRHVGDDVVLVKLGGEIVPYADDAQALVAATALAQG
jgi:hypothetical protein